MIARRLTRQPDRELVEATLIFFVIRCRKNDGLICNRFLIIGSIFLSLFSDLIEVAELNAKQCGLNVGEAPVVTDDFMAVGFDHSVISKETNPLAREWVVRRDKPSFAAGDVLTAVKRKDRSSRTTDRTHAAQ